MIAIQIQKCLCRGFQWYGELVGRRPLLFLIIPLIFTLIVSPATLLITFEEDIILLFTPANSPSRVEQETFRQFSRMEAVSKVNDVPSSYSVALVPTIPKMFWWFTICIMRQNESNIMVHEAWANMYNVLKYVYSNFTCTTKSGVKLSYMPDFCNPKTGCVRMDRHFEKIVQFLPGGNLQNDSHIKLTYPMLEVFGQKVNWAEIIFGGKVDKTTNILLEAKVVFVYLEFQFERNTSMTADAIGCMHELQNYFYKKNGYGGLEFYPLHENMVKDELYKTKYYTLPYLAGTILLVTSFSMLSSIERGYGLINSANALLGVFTIGLALAGSFGFMFICGLYFNVMITITPFITMCVGIDNDFLLAAAWRQADKTLPVSKRLGVTFADACPSLTITSFTDILCFTIGTMIDTPAVSKFCIFTAVTLTFRYIYQVTFFAAVMAYGGMFETCDFRLNILTLKNILHVLIYYRPMSMKQMKKPTFESIGVKHAFQPLKQGEQHEVLSISATPVSKMVSTDAKPQQHLAHSFFKCQWAPFICRRPVKIFTLCLFFIYLCISTFYALRIQVNIKARKLMVDDSPLLKGLKMAEKYIFSNAAIGHGFVLNPLDFRIESNRITMLRFLSVIENTTYSTGSVTTTVWFRDYLDYLEQFEMRAEPNNYLSDFYRELDGFLKTDAFSKYRSDFRFKTNLTELQIRNGEPILEKFKFRVYFEGVKTWKDHIDLLLIWRRTCADFPELSALFFDHTNLNPYYDQWLSLGPTTLQTTCVAVICISIVTALLMPNLCSTYFITLSFVSIDVGVIGFLQAWGADLDPTTMACILMTIGFSIYYTSRVCFCFQRADQMLSPDEKVALALGSTGWPILQGGVATFLGIFPLIFVKSFMVRLFFKSVALVVWFGLLHGLLFMPVIMSCLDNSAKNVKRQQKSQILHSER